MPLTGLIYKQMKPVPPPSGDTGCWMKPPAPLSAKNAPKTAVYDQQRCQRLQSKGKSTDKGANGCTPERRSTNKGATSFTTTWVSISSSLRPSDSITHPATKVPTVAPQREKALPKVPTVAPRREKHQQRCHQFHHRARKPDKVSEDSTHRDESTRSEGVECSRSGAYLTPTSIVMNLEAKSHSLCPGQCRGPTTMPVGGGLAM